MGKALAIRDNSFESDSFESDSFESDDLWEAHPISKDRPHYGPFTLRPRIRSEFISGSEMDTALTGVLEVENERKAPMIAKTEPRFRLGQIVATPGALDALEKARQTATEFLQRHARGDWGDVCHEDRQANDDALIDGSRLLSAFRTTLGEKIWIIPEAVDDSGHRAATTILLPSEY